MLIRLCFKLIIHSNISLYLSNYFIYKQIEYRSNEKNINEFFADHGFYSDREFPAFTVIDETLNVNSTGLIGFINDIIELTSLDILKFYFSKIFDRPINNIRSVMGQNFRT